MLALSRTHVEVYLFRRLRGRVEFLCLRRSPSRALAGVWQPVTGRIRRGESALRAAVREVREETGMLPGRWWALETVSLYFDAAADQMRALPLFAAEVHPQAQIRLSAEHDAFRFASTAAAGRLFLWEAQRRGLDAVRREVLNAKALARALEVTALARGRRRVSGRRPAHSAV